MTREQRLQLYARTPVWLWPFLFLQLRALKAWHLAAGHAEILVGMTPDYRLVVLCHSDIPAPAIAGPAGPFSRLWDAVPAALGLLTRPPVPDMTAGGGLPSPLPCHTPAWRDSS